VVPELRRAVRSASAAGLGGHELRATLNDVEALMAERHSVVLERFGLVAALEWLAERTEERSTTKVQIEVDTAAGEAEVSRDVARAAFRVALLAVDNAVRHAPGAPVTIMVAESAAVLRLEVHDAGPGTDPEAARRSSLAGHRGLADMEGAAAEVGARIAFGDAAGASTGGTSITFSWPSPPSR
jgi:signal transduction histidine kinase